MRSKKRLFSRCKAGAAGRRAAWAAAAHHVCRRSAVRADEQAAALLGSALRQTQSGCAAHPRNIYLYGAVCPKDGTCVYVIMPTSHTACFQVFLDPLSPPFA